MQKTLDEIVAGADWKELTPRLLYYADKLIRRCPWRGIPVSAQAGSKLCVEGYGSDDFLQEGLDRFLTGRRAYDYSMSIEQNLRGAIRSIVWSVNKSSRRTPLLDIAQAQRETYSDPIEQLSSSTSSVEVGVIADEEAEKQQRILDEFEKSLIHENDLLRLVAAYKAAHFKPRDVEKFTGIPAARISELKRKLRIRMERFEAQLTRHDNS
jgi:hypothetical protein